MVDVVIRAFEQAISDGSGVALLAFRDLSKLINGEAGR
jgi:hypothetical protein